MIYTNILGGLGNQMFQYAIGKSLSTIHNVDFKIDVSKMSTYELRSFSLSKFNISGEVAENNEVACFQYNIYLDFILKKLHKFNIKLGGKTYENNEFFYDKNMLSIKNGYLFGYWQSFKYFDNIREVLLNEFTLVKEYDFENKVIQNKINSTNSISLHIRRGDYVNDSKNNKLYNVFGIEYYNKSIDYIQNNVNNPCFFVFSDDLEWASNNLKINNAVFVEANKLSNPQNDLVLMSHCKHNIIANSTFSWWGAWLNQNSDKIVIAPKSWISTIDCLDDLYPKEWIKL